MKDLLLNLLTNNRKVLVVGLGISGLAVAKVLREAGFRIIAIEKKSRGDIALAGNAASDIEKLYRMDAEIYFGIDGEALSELLSDVGLCVLSPGVSQESAVVGVLQRHRVRCVSELELALNLSGSPYIVVTGSNGKSTTSSLIHFILDKAGIQASLCGNIGTPVISSIGADRLKNTLSGSGHAQNILVVEASSYQLEACDSLKPKAVLILNISDNHLERHGSMERYVAAKSRVFAGQEEDSYSILNGDDPYFLCFKRSSKGKLAVFKEQPTSNCVLSEREAVFDPACGVVQVNVSGEIEEYDLAGCHLIGVHNQSNICAAVLAARLMGAGAESIVQAIREFLPLEHRLEPCGSVGGVDFINDSKSTTVAATAAAVKAVCSHYKKRHVVLLTGGLAKAGSWRPLVETLQGGQSSVRKVVCFGADERILKDHFNNGGIKSILGGSLDQAFKTACAEAWPGDIVLFSPGCASFDEFSDFETRGRYFKDLVCGAVGERLSGSGAISLTSNHPNGR